MIDKKLSNYINKSFPKLLNKLLAAERKDKRNARKMKKGFSNVDEYIWKTSSLTPFVSNEGIKIYMNEVSFYMLDMMFPDEKVAITIPVYKKRAHTNKWPFVHFNEYSYALKLINAISTQNLILETNYNVM